MRPTILFFGSFQHYSALILEALIEAPQLEIVGVVTTSLDNPVAKIAQKYHLPVWAPEQVDENGLGLIDQQLKNRPELILTAGYGRLLPGIFLNYPNKMALNLHFSLLPQYRGANPAEWAILQNETQTGVSLIKMSPQFDTGEIIYQQALSIDPAETRETLYQKLYQLGAQILPDILANLDQYPLKPQPKTKNLIYAKKLNRSDGFIAWEQIFKLPASEVERKIRALKGFPGVWTIVPTHKGPKRMKIFSCCLAQNQLILDEVQMEGQNLAKFNEIKNQLAA